MKKHFRQRNYVVLVLQKYQRKIKNSAYAEIIYTAFENHVMKKLENFLQNISYISISLFHSVM